MNINYHYYTIKTLALVAGFPEPIAQRIAHFSQYVDDCVMPRLILTKNTPSQWFIDQQLAKQVSKKHWKVMLCSTGIDIGRSVSDAFQCHTLVPFHFISPKPLPELKKESSRTAYRCITATPQGEPSKGLLIDTLMDTFLHKLSQTNDKSKEDALYIELGMLLHTYADTYAHCYFSGLRGYENQSKINYAFEKIKNKKAIHTPQRKIFEVLPSIGHTNVSIMPDVCYYRVKYTFKSDQSKTIKIERDNTEFFAICSKNILAILCRITGKTSLTDKEFAVLQKNIAKAQSVKKEEPKYLKKSWEKTFAYLGSNYTYDKHQYFKLSYLFHKHLKHLNMDEATMIELLDAASSDEFEPFEPEPTDPYAKHISKIKKEVDPLEAYAKEYTDDTVEKKDTGNKVSQNSQEKSYAVLVPMRGLNEDFYTFIQLAYERILAVTGEYKQFQQSFSKHFELNT